MSEKIAAPILTPIPGYDGDATYTKPKSNRKRIADLLFALECPKVPVTKHNAQQTFENLFAYLEDCKEELVSMSYTRTLLNTYINEPKSAETLQYLWLDTTNVIKSLFANKTPVQGGQRRVYLATIGAPGAGKTTVLEKFLNAAKAFAYRNIVLCDPDQPILRMMSNLYQRFSLSNLQIAKDNNYKVTNKNAYEYCRNGSNLINNIMLNMAYIGGYNIAHGTTSTGKLVPEIVKAAKRKKMFVHFLAVAAPDDVRAKNIGFREDVVGNHQSTASDALTKGIDFLKRLPEMFSTSMADRVDIYFSPKKQKTHYLATFQKAAPIEHKRHLVLTDITSNQDHLSATANTQPTFVSFTNNEIAKQNLDYKIKPVTEQILRVAEYVKEESTQTKPLPNILHKDVDGRYRVVNIRPSTYGLQ